MIKRALHILDASNLQGALVTLLGMSGFHLAGYSKVYLGGSLAVPP